MSNTPFSRISGPQQTPLGALSPYQLLKDAYYLISGDSGQVAQATDEQGRTLFKSGLSGLPAKWEDLQSDDNRIPNLVPVPITIERPLDGQMYAGRGVSGATHRYDVVGTTAGKNYQIGFSTGLLAAHFSVPGTPEKADIIAMRKMNQADRAVAFKLPSDGSEKTISATVSGINKNVWGQLKSLKVVPNQEIAVQTTNGGRTFIVSNDGPPTTACLSVTDSKANTVSEGLCPATIGTGTTTIPMTAPVARCKNLLASSCTTGVNVDDGSFDPAGGTITYEQSPSVLNPGENTVTLSVRNTAGFSTSCTSTVTVADAMPPQFTSVPANVVSNPCTGAVGPSGNAQATDNCGGTVTITNDAPASYARGVTTVTWTATDESGNSSTYQQTITVISDTTPPQFVATPPNVAGDVCTGVASIGTATAQDNCGAVTVTNNAPASFPGGTTMVTWTATDAAGNAATYQQAVTVAGPIDLGSENAISSVANNACLKVTQYPSWAAYMHTVVIQPQGGGTGFPIPFTWTNCEGGGSGSLQGPWMQGTASPINTGCPTLIKLRGNGAGPVSLTWWGNG